MRAVDVQGKKQKPRSIDILPVICFFLNKQSYIRTVQQVFNHRKGKSRWCLNFMTTLAFGRRHKMYIFPYYCHFKDTVPCVIWLNSSHCDCLNCIITKNNTECEKHFFFLILKKKETSKYVETGAAFLWTVLNNGNNIKTTTAICGDRLCSSNDTEGGETARGLNGGATPH